MTNSDANANRVNRQRLLDIDRAKGIAIILVVFGHLARGQGPLVPEWYFQAKEMVYAFHMAFFMFLSGFIFRYRYKPLNSANAYVAYVAEKVWRLVPAYVLFATLIWIGKSTLYPHVFVENPPAANESLLALVLYPMSSYSVFLWFVLVLLEFYVVVPALLWVFRGMLIPLLILAACLYNIEGPELFALNMFCSFFVFFVLGMLSAAYLYEYNKLIDRLWIVFVVMFLGCLVAIGYGHDMPSVMVGLFAIPALHGLVRNSVLAKATVLETLGIYTFVIYLMNTIVVGILKAAALLFIPKPANSTLGVNVMVALLVLAGVLIPIVVKRIVLARIPLLDRMTS